MLHEVLHTLSDANLLIQFHAQRISLAVGAAALLRQGDEEVVNTATIGRAESNDPSSVTSPGLV
jgi:hypothetical protein